MLTTSSRVSMATTGPRLGTVSITTPCVVGPSAGHGRNRHVLTIGGRAGTGLRQQADLAGLDLQREIPGVDAALGEAAGDEPQARLRGAREHVAQLLPLPESPDRTD